MTAKDEQILNALTPESKAPRGIDRYFNERMTRPTGDFQLKFEAIFWLYAFMRVVIRRRWYHRQNLAGGLGKVARKRLEFMQLAKGRPTFIV